MYIKITEEKMKIKTNIHQSLTKYTNHLIPNCILSQIKDFLTLPHIVGQGTRKTPSFPHYTLRSLFFSLFIFSITRHGVNLFIDQSDYHSKTCFSPPKKTKIGTF